MSAVVRERGEVALTNRLRSVMNQFLQYEDSFLQAEALQIIPLDDMYKKATEKMEEDVQKRKNESSECENCQTISCSCESDSEEFSDFLYRELLYWFRGWFTWVGSSIPCETCGKETKRAGNAPPTPNERRDLASVVELYSCCSEPEKHPISRFPRFNHVRKLLKTRRGRCGEWSQAFALCARAVGFDIRFILDFSDHVWVEMYSRHLRRWVHTDTAPEWDRPLLYENGWKKKLSYIFAFNSEEVVDVTKRYTNRFNECLYRRNLVSEQSLQRIVASLHAQALTCRSESDQRTSLGRWWNEQKELANPMPDRNS